MIILDDSAPDALLEATARALTYYLDVSAECTRRISNVCKALSVEKCTILGEMTLFLRYAELY